MFSTIINTLRRIPITLEIIALAVFSYWLYIEPSPEPLASVILTLGAIILHVVPASNPKEKIAHRLRIKKEFEDHAAWSAKYKIYGEAIIRDVDRIDNYPEIDGKQKSVSSWFKVEIKGLYHRGVEVFLYGESAKFTKNRWRFCDYKDPNAMQVAVIGRIPFDLIETIDWGGDEYYREPHFYVKFDKKRKEPYEEIVVFQIITLEDDKSYYEEIGNIKNFT